MDTLITSSRPFQEHPRLLFFFCTVLRPGRIIYEFNDEPLLSIIHDAPLMTDRQTNSASQDESLVVVSPHRHFGGCSNGMSVYYASCTVDHPTTELDAQGHYYTS